MQEIIFVIGGDGVCTIIYCSYLLHPYFQINKYINILMISYSLLLLLCQIHSHLNLFLNSESPTLDNLIINAKLETIEVS